MSDSVFKKIELVGTSTVSIDAAIQNAVAKAAASLRQLRWFEVVETRGSIEGDGVREWQVTVKIGFKVDD